MKAKKKKGGRRGSFQVQALLFPREKWSATRASTWARKNGHRGWPVEEGSSYFSIRQHDASDYQKGSLHNIEIAKNVEATVGVPLSHSDAASTPGWNKRGPRQGSLFSRQKAVSDEYRPPVDPDDVLY